LQNNSILLGKPNVGKVVPSQVSQAEVLAKYVAENFKGENILLFNSTHAKDKPNQNAFKKAANPVLTLAKADSVKEVTFSTLKNFISKTKTNIIVIPSANESFVSEAVNKLYRMKLEQKDSILVFGLHNWNEMESLNFPYLQQLYVHLASCSYVDYTDAATKNFIQRYRSEFKTEPTQYSFMGFDMGWYFLNGIKKYGSYFCAHLNEFSESGMQTRFAFFRAEKNSGYENRAVEIVKMKEYQYVRVK
jgi:ABC-type branched-subunit amino acid transport system substrate-binding protein